MVGIYYEHFSTIFYSQSSKIYDFVILKLQTNHKVTCLTATNRKLDMTIVNGQTAKFMPDHSHCPGHGSKI